MSKRFKDRGAARNHMIKSAREMYRLELPESFQISLENVSLKGRHVYFSSNTRYEVWSGVVKEADVIRYLICDPSSGNIALLDKSDFNSKN